jgi:uncharacterized protein involved in exopolysaccharide biosynthesis
LLGLIAGVGFALIQPKIFRAEALLQVRQQSGSLGGLGGLASLAAEFGGLPGAGALSLGGGDTDREVALATLRSRTVVEAFIAEKNLLPRIHEYRWYGNAKVWGGADAGDTPTLWQAYNDFTKDVLRISEDRKSGLVTLAVEWTNPEEAQQWVTELVARANAHLKERAIQEGEGNLEYLQGQAQHIGQVELVQALYGLVEEQLKQMMMAKGGAEFALKTIDPAVVPTKRIKPNRAYISLAGLFLGGALGAALTLWRASWTRRVHSGRREVVAPDR